MVNQYIVNQYIVNQYIVNRYIVNLVIMMNQLSLAENTVQATWARLQILYSGLTKPCPSITLNSRLKTTAGRCFYTLRKVDLSTELFAQYPDNFVRDTIPHELAHQVSWDLYEHGGHLEPWRSVMRALGIVPRRTHTMHNANRK